MLEKLDVYDNNKNRTGKIVERKYGGTLEKGEYIISVQCWIINSNKKILLTQRKLNKKDGGMWEPTTGLVISGESSLQGIKRELFEEIGLKFNDNEIKLINTKLDERMDVSFIRDIYLVNKEILLNEIKFNDKEVINVKYVTIEEFIYMLKNKEIPQYLEYFIQLYNEVK